MSRSTLLLLVILLVVIAGVVALLRMGTDVPVSRIELPVANEALAH